MTAEPTLFDLPGADGTPTADPVATATECPAWLERVLERGLTWRRSAWAKLGRCRCGVLVLHAADMGLDLATESTVDPALLTAEAELAVLLAGRYTAELEVSRFGGGVLVFRRDRWLVQRPAAARRRLCVPQHTCYQPVGVPFPLELLFPLESKTDERSQHHAEPPF